MSAYSLHAKQYMNKGQCQSTCNLGKGDNARCGCRMQKKSCRYLLSYSSRVAKVVHFGEVEVLEGQRQYHSKERWRFSIGSPLYDHSAIRPQFAISPQWGVYRKPPSLSRMPGCLTKMYIFCVHPETRYFLHLQRWNLYDLIIVRPTSHICMVLRVNYGLSQNNH